jgi:beta-phosphoglucomutase
MPSKYQAIHFDMDGVIADTEAFHVAAEQQTCRDFGFAIEPDQWSGFKGQTAPDIFNHLIREYGDPKQHRADDLISHKTAVFVDSLSDRLVAIEGVLDFLRWARDNHRHMSLVTSSNRRVQSFVTDTLGITELFDTIVTGDDITHGKPSPQPYLTALERLGVAGERSVVIEDSKSGISSGLGAGCDVLAVTTSHTRAELVASRPTYIAETYLKARALLEAV